MRLLEFVTEGVDLVIMIFCICSNPSVTILMKGFTKARCAGKAALLPNPEGGRGWRWWSFLSN